MAHSFIGSQPEVFHQCENELGDHMVVSQDAWEASRTSCGCHLQWPTHNDLLQSVRLHFQKTELLSK